VTAAAELRLGERRQPVLVHDLGPGGAGIEVLDASALPHEPFHLLLGEEWVEAAVAWRNCTRAGVKFAGARLPAALPVAQGKRPAAI
jgi:hypothetical protein